MVFIIPQNRHSFVWLRWSVLLFFILSFFIFGGASLVMQLAIATSKMFLFSKNTTPLLYERVALQAKITDLESERERLYAILQKKDSLKKIIPANMQLGGGYLFMDSIIIDKGALDNVEIGDIVTTNEEIFVGSIVELGSNWSRVVSFTQLGHKMIVRGGANKQTTFEISGIGGGEAEVNLPVSLNIKVGDIYWSGEHIDYIAGIVDRIDRSSVSQIQKIYIRPPIAFKFLTKVIIQKENI